jgi:NTP pyrophosphatase (non-canonical NTP hydrolase)
MELKDLIKKAHANAEKKGFWDAERSILEKMEHDELEPVFTDDEVKLVKSVFMVVKMALITSEVSEAVEALRKDDGTNFGEELADILIRWADMIGGTMDPEMMEKIIEDKMAVNANRPVRHGKKF